MGGRAGRKRKQGARENNGRLKRKSADERIDENVRYARSLPHRRSVKSNDRTSALAESPLGRLRLMHQEAERRYGGRGLRSVIELAGVSASEYAAGEAFAAIVASYRTVIEGPRPVRSLMPDTASEYAASDDELATVRFDCPSQYADPIEKQVMIGSRVLKVREWPCRVAGAVCACRDRRERYMRTYDALASAGRLAVMAVNAVVVRGEELRATDFVNLKNGLKALVQFMRLTDD